MNRTHLRCADCSNVALLTCSACGQPKCAHHLKHWTGFGSDGFYSGPISRCLACESKGTKQPGAAARDDAIEATIAALNSASEPEQVARLVVSLPSSADDLLRAQTLIPYKTLRRAWATLVSSGALDVAPVAEIVELRYEKSLFTEKWTEHGRLDAWRYALTWLDATGMPWAKSEGGGFSSLNRVASFAMEIGETVAVRRVRTRYGNVNWVVTAGTYVTERGSGAGMLAVRNLVEKSPLVAPPD